MPPVYGQGMSIRPGYECGTVHMEIIETAAGGFRCAFLSLFCYFMMYECGHMTHVGHTTALRGNMTPMGHVTTSRGHMTRVGHATPPLVT